MLARYASEFGWTASPEMSWFHGLSAGKTWSEARLADSPKAVPPDESALPESPPVEVPTPPLSDAPSAPSPEPVDGDPLEFEPT
ncbi:MAG: hypothetical protein AMXMBFR47_01930 [Planctomycetota bacterium]